MAAPFEFERCIAFSAEGAAETLRGIPALPGVFALWGHDASAQPYLTRAADLRRRIARILAPPEISAAGRTAQSKRLNLRERVARIEYTVTGSEFESTLALYHASAVIFGLDEARRRLRLRTPFFLRFTAENAFPRVYSTNRLAKRVLDETYGPFPSRAAADRYCDAVLDLFKLRRCHEELAPHAEHPGCVYGEMNKCLAPCQNAQTPEGAAAYATEAAAVRRFFETRGESMIVEIGLAREVASSAMEFEKAAELHAQWHKVKAAQALADELVQPVPKLRAVILQRASNMPLALQGSGDEGSVVDEAASQRVAAFLLEGGRLCGPAMLSTLGVRAVREQTSVGSSLFAQPLMLEAVPLTGDGSPVSATPLAPSESPEARAIAVITSLEAKAAASPVDLGTLSDHISMLRRWYYRPEKQRAGEMFFPDANHQWPMRRVLNGAARVALGDPKPMAETQRELVERNPADEAQKPKRTKVLHKGRPDVERVVPVVEKAPAFTSRRTQPEDET